MADVKTQIQQFATAEETKVKSWWQSHWVTFVAGMGALELLRFLVTHHL